MRLCSLKYSNMFVMVVKHNIFTSSFKDAHMLMKDFSNLILKNNCCVPFYPSISVLIKNRTYFKLWQSPVNYKPGYMNYETD